MANIRQPNPIYFGSVKKDLLTYVEKTAPKYRGRSFDSPTPRPTWRVSKENRQYSKPETPSKYKVAHGMGLKYISAHINPSEYQSIDNAREFANGLLKYVPTTSLARQILLSSYARRFSGKQIKIIAEEVLITNAFARDFQNIIRRWNKWRKKREKQKK